MGRVAQRRRTQAIRALLAVDPVVYVVTIGSRHVGPQLVGYYDQLPAAPAMRGDLVPDPGLAGGATHRWGACWVRLATAAETVVRRAAAPSERPYQLFGGRPVPRAPILSRGVV